MSKKRVYHDTTVTLAPLTADEALSALLKTAPPPKGRQADAEGCAEEWNEEAWALAFRIAHMDRLTEGIGFSLEAVCYDFVFHLVLARGLKVIPQALDERQTLAAVVGNGAGSHERRSIGRSDKIKNRAFCLHAGPEAVLY
jgi:hypothetical protein